jgi:DNA repair protein RadC
MLPRERGMMHGFETLADSELLAVLLGTGEKGRPVLRVAAEMLEMQGGIAGVYLTGPLTLADMTGIGTAKAARVAAAFELGRRLAFSASAQRPTLASSEAVAKWGRLHLGLLDHEQVWVLSLDGKNRLRGARRVAEGGLHGCSLEPRDVLRAVVRDAASAFVMLHNHPSGDARPSEEDVELTRVVARAAAVVGTPLVDHVIIAGDEHASLFDLGILRHGPAAPSE